MIQWESLTWDQLGNLTERNDHINALDEKYGYDELNRLLSITLNGAAENSFTYDVLGDMLTKGDVGTYTYPATGAVQPHGVSKITSGSNVTNVVYDADGNILTESGATCRTMTWTPYNMPLTVQYAGGNTLTFQYDADHNRVMQTEAGNTTYYLPDGEQTPGAVWHTYFEAGGQRVAEDYGVTGSLKHHYFHNDYQNTIGLVTDDTFNPNTDLPLAQNELSDVFGQPRYTTGAIDSTWGANDVTKRRYINQEDLTDAHLIDLNARIYDPLLGKFVSPDPVIADQDDSQSWNAYAYSHNNPMSKEDPTGLDDAVPAAASRNTDDDDPQATHICFSDCSHLMAKANDGKKYNISVAFAAQLEVHGSTLSAQASSAVAQSFVGAIANGMNAADRSEGTTSQTADATVRYFHGVPGHLGTGIDTNDTVGWYPSITQDAWTRFQEGVDSDVPGQVYKDNEKEKGAAWDSITIPTTPAQDDAMRAAIVTRSLSHEQYNLYHCNCSEFVRDVLRAVQVNAPDYMIPLMEFKMLQEMYPTLPVSHGTVAP